MGAKAWIVDWSRQGYVKVSHQGRYFPIKELELLLIQDYGYTEQDAKQMCWPTGLDFFEGSAMCCETGRRGHEGPNTRCHQFPEGFEEAARAKIPDW